MECENKEINENSIEQHRLHKNIPGVFAAVTVCFHAFSILNKVLINL
jgi:hypothetical protein